MSTLATVPVAVVIPTYARGVRVLETLRRIADCNPRPSEIWIHIDASDGSLESEITAQFPSVFLISSPQRVGPGGGRHRGLEKCTVPYAVSFDDDSWPVDPDFFARVVEGFDRFEKAAILGAAIWHPHEAEKARTDDIKAMSSYTGCGYAIRVNAYRQTRGHIDAPIAYGMEETDLSLRLFVAGWSILEWNQLRVFHDTTLSHHRTPEIVAGTIANVGLYAFLHYPVSAWPHGFLQVMNATAFCLRKRRFRGIVKGLLSIPFLCWQHRENRLPIDHHTLKRYLRSRKSYATKAVSLSGNP